MKNWTVLLAAAALLSKAAQAQTSPVAGNRVTVGLDLQETGYEGDDDDGSSDIEGQILLAGYKAAINSKLTVGGGFGYMLDGELDPGPEDGEGFRLFGDGQYLFHSSGPNQIHGTVALSHDRFEFDNGVEIKLTEIKFGGLFIHRIREFGLFGGLELVAYSDGEVEVETPNLSWDIERDDRLNLRVGATFAVDSALDLRADLLLIGEQTLLFAADFAI